MATYSLAQLNTQAIDEATKRLALTNAQSAFQASTAVYQAMLQQNEIDVLNGQPPAE